MILRTQFDLLLVRKEAGEGISALLTGPIEQRDEVYI